jgi:hypothetical protein
MTVRAKFRCVKVEHSAYMTAVKYTFAPQYDQTIPEDRRFAVASPAGEKWINVVNPAVTFEMGDYYYLDFSPVPAPEPAIA